MSNRKNLFRGLMEDITYGDTWEQAKRLRNLHDHGHSDAAICEEEKISEENLLRSLRAFSLAVQYQDSEYGDQFTEEHFVIFYELLKSSVFKPIREWLGWHEEKHQATNKDNAEIFFSLLSRTPNLTKAGEYLQPAITQWDNFIGLSAIIRNKAALGLLRTTHDLHNAYAITPEGQADKKIKKAEIIQKGNTLFLQRKTDSNVKKQEVPSTTINLIRLQGYKSIANTTLEGTSSFSVFAGSNGSGKSNLVDGLAFFGTVVAQGAKQAIRQFGGFNQIHCFKFKKENARTVSLELEIQLDDSIFHYTIKIYQLDTEPQVEEMLTIDGDLWLKRDRGKGHDIGIWNTGKGGLRTVPDYPDNMSALMLLSYTPIYTFMTNIRVFRFDPLGAKEPDTLSADSTELDTHGRNVATMLSVLEKKTEFREQILEWIELLVPGMEKVKTEQQKLDGSTVIKFKEEGMKTFLPAKLISDGTIYALCILTAVLSRAKGQGMTIIEEPERGIHPQAIAELVSLMRANASPEHPVWVTTHSESVVRSATADELWLINKVDGKTELKNAGKNSVPLGNMNLDKAWLMNFFDGGLPW